MFWPRTNNADAQKSQWLRKAGGVLKCLLEKWRAPACRAIQRLPLALLSLDPSLLAGHEVATAARSAASVKIYVGELQAHVLAPVTVTIALREGLLSNLHVKSLIV